MSGRQATAKAAHSAKAAGKRPAMDPMTHSETEKSATQTKPGAQTRQKRVLPSRSRRGGPGVGGCEVDVLILETRKRRLDSEPLIPSTTRFLLTTKSALVPSPPEGSKDSSRVDINEHALGRYFDRPEVRQACKYQQLIQTPEFTQLPDDAIVGGRFRPRGSQEEAVDTSDAAYEKRHRKYETFEKRQRLREKEKLKHEQYKLKERIEQLRAMDPPAFLTLPASKFSEPPGALQTDEYDETDVGLADLPGAHVNGATAYNEGERRKREMLDIAQGLEERYRVLLPPDRKWAEKKEKAKRDSIGDSRESDHMNFDTMDEDPSVQEVELLVDDSPAPTASSDSESESVQESEGESEVDFDAREGEQLKGLRLRIKLPPQPSVSSRHTAGQDKFPKPKATIQTLLPFASIHTHPVTVSPPTSSIGRGINGRSVAKNKLLGTELVVNGSDSISQSPVKKRPRPNSPVSPAASRYSHTSSTRTPCLLMIAAARNATAPASRKTHRHVTAFGARVPPELEEIRDYELPAWITSEEEDSENEQFEDAGSPSQGWTEGMVWYDHASPYASS